MTGILRTFLALAVALSHVPGVGMKFQLGVVAVMLFYFLSGNVMYRAYEKFKQSAPHPIRSFYLDRFLRIWPAFAAAVFLTAGLVRSFKNQILTFPKPDVSSWAIAQNFNLFCMNDNGVCKVPRVIHTSWSLGSEIHFYLLLPALIAMPFMLFALCTVASVSWHLFALLSMGPHQAHYWAYGSSYGTLFVFCMGICYARREDARYRALLGAIIALEAACVLVIYPLMTPQAYGNFFIQEMWLGVIIATPLVFAAEKAKVIPAKIDHWIGSLSYPIFVCQVFAMGVADVVIGMKYPSRRWMVVFLVTLGAVSLAVTYLVERPMGKLRHRLMRRAKPAIKAASAPQPAE